MAIQEKRIRRITNPNTQGMADNISAGTQDSDTETWSLLLHWSAKETIFKCLNTSDVDFREHLRIFPFEVEEQGVFSAGEYRTAEKRCFAIHYYLFPDFVLTMSV